MARQPRMRRSSVRARLASLRMAAAHLIEHTNPHGAAFSIISDMPTGTATRGAHPHASRRPARREKDIRYPQNYAMSQSCFTQ